MHRSAVEFRVEVEGVRLGWRSAAWQLANGCLHSVALSLSSCKLTAVRLKEGL